MGRALAAVAVLILAIGAAAADGTPAAEARKIQALLEHVRGLDAAFVRNDTVHDAKAAAEFLRRKWKANEADVRTANDFIDKVASKSSTSGKPYVIRFKDGREVQSAEHLRARLVEIASAEGGHP